MGKIKVEQRVEAEDVDLNYRTLYQVKDYVHQLIDEFSGEHYFKIYDDYGDYRLGLFCLREETDGEYAARLERDSGLREWRRKQYEKLKTEFEGDNP